MLAKAVAAVQADKTKALAMVNKGEGGFLDGDLYPFCFNISDGTEVANVSQPVLIGRSVEGRHRQGVWPGTLQCGAKTGG